MRNPAFFQGYHRRKRYFEGWYFKCISADRSHAIAIIPGMAADPHGARHAFIQIIDAVSGRTAYFHFPYADFVAQRDRFAVQIGSNTFDASGLSLDLASPEGTVAGNLRFLNAHAFPSSRWSPGIMGPFSFVPGMECYHAIIHLTHGLQGAITIDGVIMDFSGGAGYIEKDYGRSFPKTYLWLQASHFDHGDASFVFSRARIPFLGRSFPGFFAYFTDFRNPACRFATYNQSRLEEWQVDPERGTCSGKLSGPSGTLFFQAQMAGGGHLRAPVDGLMDRVIIESITARVTLRLVDPQGNLIYEGSSSEAGMEISH